MSNRNRKESQQPVQPEPQFSDRPAPYSEQNEEATLGCILTNPNAFYDAKEILQGGEDYYILRHQYVWDAMERIDERGEEIDYVTVAKELRDMGKLDEVGGEFYLLRLVNNTPTSVHVKTYANIVARAADRRRLLTAAAEIAALALNEEMPFGEVHSRSEILLSGAIEDNRHQVVYGSAADEDYEGVLEDRREAAARGELTIYPLPHEWITLRKYIPGFPGGKLIVISGATGSGKSAFLEMFGEYMAQEGVLADFYHTEMSKEDVQDRRMARHAGIAFDRLLQPHLLTDGELENKDQIRIWMKTWMPNWTCHAMPDVKFLALANTMINRARRGVKVFLIDHFQDIQIEAKKGENDIRAIESIATWLTAFAESRKVLVIVASQENTAGGTKWSAKLSEKAALRISIKQKELQNPLSYFIDDTEYRLNTGDADPNCWFVIGKSRFGKKGKVPMFQFGSAFTWKDTSEIRYAPVVRQQPKINGKTTLDASVFGPDGKYKN